MDNDDPDVYINYLKKTYKSHTIIDITDPIDDEKFNANEYLRNPKILLVKRRTIENANLFALMEKEFLTSDAKWIIFKREIVMLMADFNESIIRKFMVEENIECGCCNKEQNNGLYCSECGYFICPPCIKRKVYCPQCNNKYEG